MHVPGYSFTINEPRCEKTGLRGFRPGPTLIDQELISVRALVFDLAQLTCQKRLDYRNAIIRSSETFLDTS